MQRHVGVEHADQRDPREVEPLGDHLRAEQHVGLAAREGARAPPAWRRARSPRRCRGAAAAPPGRPRRSRARRAACPRRRSAASPPGTTGSAPRPAGRGRSSGSASASGARCRVSEMSQFGHCGREAAGPALRVVRVAAAVQEQHRLLAALEPLRQRLAQRPRQQRVAGALAPQVHDPHRGQRPRVHARGQPQQPVLAARGVGQRLEARRGRAQHHRDAEQLRAAHGHVAPVVAQHLALLVGGLVLLVHDDEPEVRQRREHRRARADHHVERAAAAPAPSCAGARPPSGTSGARRRAAEKRRRNAATTCEPSATSGTSTSACPPASRAAWAARR